MTQDAGKENVFLNLILNIAIPTLVLMKLSGDQYLGNKLGLIVALSFPIAYGLYDFKTRSKVNFFSILGVVSVLLTGGISLLELDPKYIAIKEASIPGLLGIATLISVKTRYPLVKALIFNKNLLQVDKINEALKRNQAESGFQSSLRTGTVLVAGSFLMSSVLNYVLAKMIVVSQPGTEQFNIELGKLTAMSYPVIALPSMLVLLAILFYLARSITKHTGLALEEIIIDPDSAKGGKKSDSSETGEEHS